MSIKDSIATAIKLLVDVRDAELKASLHAALLEAQNAALDLQERVARLQENDARLRKQIDDYSRSEDLESDLYFARNAMWRKSETALSAYCTTCWGKDRMLIRLKPGYGSGGGAGLCPVCKYAHHYVFSSDSRPPPE